MNTTTFLINVKKFYQELVSEELSENDINSNEWGVEEFGWGEDKLLKEEGWDIERGLP